jgi:hypothetical protein
MRRQPFTIAPANATISWQVSSGKPTGYNSNKRPIFEETTHTVRAWLEQNSTETNEEFDSSDQSEFEDITFVGRIYDPYDASLYLQETVDVVLDYTMGASTAIEMKARVLWAGAVAIDSPSLRVKQQIGEAITLVGKVRRNVKP